MVNLESIVEGMGLFAIGVIGLYVVIGTAFAATIRGTATRYRDTHPNGNNEQVYRDSNK